MQTNNKWFKRKLYGWGWSPCTWQGWFITAFYLAVVLAAAMSIDENVPKDERAMVFYITFGVATIIFIAISYIKGDKPRWQWGYDTDDDDSIK